MSNKTYPTPSISEESRFHELNALILKSHNLLVNGQNLSYSEVASLVNTIYLSRDRAKGFNTKFGLEKEIA